MECSHVIVECPNNLGNWDCTSFCPHCEGYGEFCDTCGANGNHIGGDDDD